jgi:hypothetical protein
MVPEEPKYFRYLVPQEPIIIKIQFLRNHLISYQKLPKYGSSGTTFFMKWFLRETHFL